MSSISVGCALSTVREEGEEEGEEDDEEEEDDDDTHQSTRGARRGAGAGAAEEAGGEEEFEDEWTLDRHGGAIIGLRASSHGMDAGDEGDAGACGAAQARCGGGGDDPLEAYLPQLGVRRV
eukprot:6845379-Prymnesium_polylepis.1